MGKKRNTWSGPWGIALILLIILPILPSLCSSEEIYKFKRMWPTLQQPWYFNRPDGIAVDSSGNFYVSDSMNHYIQKYTPDGQFITKWGSFGIGDGEFIEPPGIAVDSNDFVYVADKHNNRIQKFTSDGRFITAWGSEGSGDGEFDWPQGIAADSSGFIYVTQTNNDRIQKFTSDGHFVTKWGSPGSGEGEFDNPQGITVDKDGFVYVADSYNHRIQKFTPDGHFIMEWGDLWSGLPYPQDVATDVEGNVYVAISYEIIKFTSDGQLITKWGDKDPGDGELDYAWGIALDKTGNVYVTDQQKESIQKYTSDGRFITKYGASGSNSGEFKYPYGIAVDNSGNVYVADEQNHRIQKFTLDGQFITEWGSRGIGDGEFDEPSGIAVDSNGNVYVADNWNKRIQKLTGDGDFLTEWELEFLPYDIAVGNSGEVYVPDGLGHRILKFTSDGQFIREWGSEGNGDGEFNFIVGIAVDKDGNVYGADDQLFNDYESLPRIQKFTPDGQFITTWSSAASGCYGPYLSTRGIAVDSSGNVYLIVGDAIQICIQKFTSDGQFITSWGSRGTYPGKMVWPQGIAVAPNGDVYVTEYEGNHRVQVFERVTMASNTKAIIVAGGGAYPGNNLWDATQMCANFAYRTLTYQGFTKESIYYLTSDTDLDLDENGVLDDVDGDATNSNLEQAIITWAADADSLVLYVVDHGGDTTFRMSSTETLSVSALDSWLDQLQQTIPGKVTVIYDACESGSFVATLTPPAGKQRVVITSTSPGESAYFVTQGSVSFSNYFWTHIFNGLNVKEAFDLAKEALGQTTTYQSPLLDDNGNGTANEPQDGVLAQNTFIGNGTVIHGSAPTVGSVSPNQLITGTSSALLYAENVTDSDGVARVWAVIRPPNYNQGGSDNPVQELPSLDLKPVDGDRYEGTYHGFNVSGTYQIAIYARDRIGNTAVPKLTTVTVDNPLKRKAIIVAGGSQSDPLWPAIEKTTTLVYQALAFQGYTHDDIYFMSPVTFSGGVDGLATSSNLSFAISNWAQQSTQDVVLYLVGKGDHGTFELSGTQTLSATDLDGWLDNLQENIPGKVTVIYDGPRAGSFLPLLTPPQGKERILLASTGMNQPAYFLSTGDISFSKFFWRKVLNGANVRDSFLHAKRAIAYACRGQTPTIDDNGNGIGNEKLDGQLARYYTIGVGIILAGDDPVIGSISPEQTLDGETSATIWVEGVTTTGTIDKVWAVITPPGYSPGSPSQTISDTPTITLNPAGNGRYEGTYNDFSTFGTYEIAAYAMDTEGNISLPKETKVFQTVGSDSYEDDDTSSQANVIVIDDIQAQVHTFYEAGDQDWVKFYGLADQTYTIEASNLGSNCDVVIQLYSTDGTTLITEEDSGFEGEEEFLVWDCRADGVYYVQVSQFDPTASGDNTEYDLKVYVPTGPPLVVFVSGAVTNAYSGKPVAGARIRTDGKATALSMPDGNYLMIHPAGTFTLMAESGGYENFTDTLTLNEAGTVTKNISMTPFDLEGDLNGDYAVDLADAIIALKVLAGTDTSGLIRSDYAGSGVDVDSDGRIGLAEALFVLQHVAGLRQ